MYKQISMTPHSTRLTTAFQQTPSFLQDYQVHLDDLHQTFGKGPYSAEKVMTMAVYLSNKPQGGPFGAILASPHNDLFTIDSIGFNQVIHKGNSMFHAETVAIMTYFQLHPQASELPKNTQLFTSSEPCTQCRSCFLCTGGHPDTIAYTLNQHDVKRFGGFDDKHLYDIAQQPLGNHPNITWLNQPVQHNFNMTISNTLTNDSWLFKLTNESTFVADLITHYLSFSKHQDDAEFPNFILSLPTLPSWLADSQHRNQLRYLISVLDWSKMTIHIQSNTNQTLFSNIVLFTPHQISTGTQFTSDLQVARSHMTEWRHRALTNNKPLYGQEKEPLI